MRRGEETWVAPTGIQYGGQGEETLAAADVLPPRTWRGWNDFTESRLAARREMANDRFHHWWTNGVSQQAYTFAPRPPFKPEGSAA